MNLHNVCIVINTVMCDFVIHCVIIMSVSRLVGSHIGYAIYGSEVSLETSI